MKETIDQTMRRWLRKWLGIEGDYKELTALQRQFKERMDLENETFARQELEQRQALTEIENTRQDLIQRMDDLGKELAERKGARDGTKAEEDAVIVSPARKTFSQRRREAQGSGRNMSAYLQPKKKSES